MTGFNFTLAARAAALTLVVSLLGCTPPDGFDRGFSSTSSEYVADLRSLMDKHAIPYRNTSSEEGQHGFQFHRADEARVALLRQMLDRHASVKYNEPEARAHLQELLTGMKQDFIVSEKADGIWIKWFPQTPQQFDAVSTKVTQHMADLQAARASSRCQEPGRQGPARSPQCRR